MPNNRSLWAVGFALLLTCADAFAQASPFSAGAGALQGSVLAGYRIIAAVIRVWRTEGVVR